VIIVTIVVVVYLVISVAIDFMKMIYAIMGIVELAVIVRINYGI
jgi:hypothetical protein